MRNKKTRVVCVRKVNEVINDSAGWVDHARDESIVREKFWDKWCDWSK